MKKEVINQRVKEILISVLNLNMEVAELDSHQALFGTEKDPGLFDDSLAVLEVTSVLMGEFDLEASAFNENSFQTIQSLTECIFENIGSVEV